MNTQAHALSHRLPWLAVLFLFLLTAGAALAQQPQEGDPPARVATLTQREGSIVFAPEGEDEWVELPQNRPLTIGDRLWTDQGARAEVHLGAATLHLDGESHLGISALDERAAQFILMQGSLNARLRELADGENFEIGTPNLALRALRPGDFRLDVSDDGQETRVVVLQGTATVFGERGQSVQLGAGQQATFAGRELAQVQDAAFRPDALAQWAAARNHAEDQSVAARHVPRGVVGYPQLDQHGSWSQHPEYGTVWYPRVASPDWAPYRQGRWEWIQPWGWTWLDDAPWGFAPFHYGRWAEIGSRWAWVPGRMVQRPVYAPALVVFMGGAGLQLGMGGPAVGWYPLGPGEPWYPSYRASPRYLGFANHTINLGAYPRNWHGHVHRQRLHAITAVREDDFRRGRNLRDRWQRVQPGFLRDTVVERVPGRPERRGDREEWRAPRLQVAPRVNVQPGAQVLRIDRDERLERRWNRREDRRDDRWDDRRNDRREDRRDDRREERWQGRDDRREGGRLERREDRREERREEGGNRRQQVEPRRDMPTLLPRDAGREQAAAQREQQRLQRAAEQEARQQQFRQVAPQFRPQQQQQQQEPQRPQRQEAARIGREQEREREREDRPTFLRRN